MACLARLEARRRQITARTEMVRERQEGHHAFVLQEGSACAYKLLPDGGRQVIDFSVPRDFMGLRSVLLCTSDHAFAALSDIVVPEVSARQMIDTFQRAPRLGQQSCWRPRATRPWWSSIWSASGGATLELGLRLRLVGLGSESGFTARPTIITWRIRSGSRRSTSTACCDSCASAGW